MSKRSSHLDPEQIKRVRALDVEWALRWAKAKDGRGFYDSYSEVTGMPAPKEMAALSFLHKSRTVVANKKERRESELWLAEHGQADMA